MRLTTRQVVLAMLSRPPASVPVCVTDEAWALWWPVEPERSGVPGTDCSHGVNRGPWPCRSSWDDNPFSEGVVCRSYANFRDYLRHVALLPPYANTCGVHHANG